jgi:protoheme IX farnesyltransferase
VIGWAAATGTLSLEPIILFLIVFFWTPPHFWALALERKADYARAGIPMLPNVAGDAETRKQILIYSLILAPLAVAPSLLGFAGKLYGASAIVLGAIFIYFAIAVYRERTNAVKHLFGFSVLYLFLLFALLLVEPMVR